jgi:hypothetical protein
VLNLSQRVVVQHEKLPRLRPGVPQQLDALGRCDSSPRRDRTIDTGLNAP